MDANIIDIALVVSLSFLALCAIIFLIYFIPVLIQLAKLLEATRTLVGLATEYVENIQNKINSVGDNISKFSNYVSGICSSVTHGVMDMIFARKK